MSTPRFDEVRPFASACGTLLWSASIGKGRPLVLCDGLGCDGFIWKYIIPQFARDHQVVRWHYRGHGDSELPPSPADLSVEGFAQDLHLLLEEWDLRGAVLLGHSMGVQVLLEAALQLPASSRHRVAGLIPICGAPGHPLHTFKNSSFGLWLLPRLRRLLRRNPEGIRRMWKKMLPSRSVLTFARWTEVNAKLMHPGDLAPYLERLAQMDPDVFFTTLANARYHDTSSRLPRIDLPVLVVAAERDTFTPLHRSSTIAERIVDSEFFVLPQATHTGPLEWPELLELRIRRFLRERIPTP